MKDKNHAKTAGIILVIFGICISVAGIFTTPLAILVGLTPIIIGIYILIGADNQPKGSMRENASKKLELAVSKCKASPHSDKTDVDIYLDYLVDGKKLELISQIRVIGMPRNEFMQRCLGYGKVKVFLSGKNESIAFEIDEKDLAAKLDLPSDAKIMKGATAVHSVNN